MGHDAEALVKSRLELKNLYPNGNEKGRGYGGVCEGGYYGAGGV